MTLTKTQNGVEVPLSEEEIAEFQAKEEAHNAMLAASLLTKYREQRRVAYPSIDSLVVAMIEDAEGRPEALEEIKLLRAQVKALYPKPTI